MALNSVAVSSTWSYSENVFDGMPERPASRSVSQVWRRSAAAVFSRPATVSRPAQNASVAFFSSRRSPIRGYPSTVASMRREYREPGLWHQPILGWQFLCQTTNQLPNVATLDRQRASRYPSVRVEQLLPS